MNGFYGGDPIVGRGTIFTPDGSSILTAGNHGLFMYSAKTATKTGQWTGHEILKYCMVATHQVNHPYPFLSNIR